MTEPKPLSKEDIIRTGQVLTGASATANFVSKDMFKSCKSNQYKLKLAEIKKIKSAIEWLKKEVNNFPNHRNMDYIVLQELIDEAFEGVMENVDNGKDKIKAQPNLDYVGLK